jgi:myo-inositol-1-phosphate synthase
VGRDVAEAILAPPNNTHRFAPVPTTKVIVERGPTLDGLGKYLRDEVPESDKSPVDVAEVLADTRPTS